MFTGLETTQAHPARRWTAVVSFSLQAMLVGAMLIVPLFRPETLPDSFKLRQIFLPEPQGVQRPQVSPAVSNPAASNAPVYPIVVRTGPAVRVADTGEHVGDSAQVPIIGVPDGRNITNILADTHYQSVPKPTVVATHTAPLSRLMEGNLLHRVEPRYPAIAVQTGIQGIVVIKALISREGTVEHPQVISGQPFLAAAAMDAVKQWRYRPYYLNGQPVEVETQITVNFVLNR